MSEAVELKDLLQQVNGDDLEAVKRHWMQSNSAQDSISRFDNLSKGWDRLASEIWPDRGFGYGFKRLTGLCTSVAWEQSIDNLLYEVDGPIKNDLERLESDAQRDFDRAKTRLQQHRNHRLDDQKLMESIGSLLWMIRSNSMHGRKTTSGPVGPTSRDEQICGLGGVVLVDLYQAVFPDWK
jgi:hypothetical protein